MKFPPLRSRQNNPVTPYVSMGRISLIRARAEPRGTRNWTVLLEIGGADLFTSDNTPPPELTPANFQLERLDGFANLSLIIADVKWIQPPTLLELSLFMDSRAEELESQKLYQPILHLLSFPGHALDLTANSTPLFLLQRTDQESSVFNEKKNRPSPLFDYMAKDFETIRALMITNINRLLPDWQEITAADMGVMITEILAYIADYLSYRQDFAANEAYLETALLETSIQRHARLLGYFSQEGCAPRTVLTFEVSDILEIPAETAVLSSHSALENRFVTRNSDLFHRSLKGGSTCFETRRPLTALPLLNRLKIHDFGLPEFTLFAGATSVIIEFPLEFIDKTLPLVSGDVIVLQHITTADLLPHTQSSGYRGAHAVRLTHIEKLRHPLKEAPDTVLVSLHWGRKDALPNNLPVTVRSAQPGKSGETIAAIFANAIEAEYGLTRKIDVPVSDTLTADDWQPEILANPLQSLSIKEDERLLAISDFLSPEPVHITYPTLMLTDYPLTGSDGPEMTTCWQPTRDLLRHGSSDRVFKMDRNEDNSITLRFGKQGMGRTPSLCRRYTAHVREAAGSTASVGANVLRIMAPEDFEFKAFASRLIQVNNPLPATASIPREARESIRLKSTDMLHDNKLCITLDDYRDFAASLKEVKDANAWIVGNEPWPYIHISVLAHHSNIVDDTLTALVRETLVERRPLGRRMIVTGPKPIPLQIIVRILPAAGYATTGLNKQITVAIGNTDTREEHGFFSADKTSFEQTLYANQLVAAISAIDGVSDLKLLAFRRLDTPGPTLNAALTFAQGEIPLLSGRKNEPEGGELLIEFEERTTA